ncbi:MAG: ATP-binding domain-containing protein, partial [Candidatus Hydrogenedentes bacterium]|nr:ATP-binding domain-containing protein [Candidatus Hydrogenedentota bacterium]
EYPVVVLPMSTQHYLMLQRNVFYTAITRAKQMVIIVGDTRAVARAVHNAQASKRYSRLAERLANR